MVYRDKECDREHIKTQGKQNQGSQGSVKSLKLEREGVRDGNPEWEGALSGLFYRRKPPEVGVLRRG